MLPRPATSTEHKASQPDTEQRRCGQQIGKWIVWELAKPLQFLDLQGLTGGDGGSPTSIPVVVGYFRLPYDQIGAQIKHADFWSGASAKLTDTSDRRLSGSSNPLAVKTTPIQRPHFVKRPIGSNDRVVARTGIAKKDL